MEPVNGIDKDVIMSGARLLPIIVSTYPVNLLSLAEDTALALLFVS